MIDYSNRETAWYAMKTTFKRELKAKSILDASSVESFIAMRQQVVIRAGRRRIVHVPAIHNLIFIKVNGDTLRDIKSKIKFLHNRLERREGVLSPIIIPQDAMERFIAVSRCEVENLIYIDLSQTLLEKGTRVRITAGQFAGYEGVLTKVKGVRQKRVVLNIEGIVAVAVTSIEASMIERI